MGEPGSSAARIAAGSPGTEGMGGPAARGPGPPAGAPVLAMGRGERPMGARDHGKEME